MFKSIFLPIIGVAAFIVVVGLLSQGKLDKFIKKDTVSNSIQKSIKIEDLEVPIEIARTNEEKATGLSKRNSLDSKSGMIFIFSNDSKPVFWMKDTKIALDIIWINDNKIVGIEKDVQPEIGIPDNKLRKYTAPSAIDYVLEVNGGFCDKNDVKVGQSLSGLEQL